MRVFGVPATTRAEPMPTKLHLAPQTLALIRPRESMSGRINGIAARYSALIDSGAEWVRAQFSAAEWGTMLDRCAANYGSRDGPAELPAIIATCLNPWRFAAWTPLDWACLAELLENDL